MRNCDGCRPLHIPQFLFAPMGSVQKTVAEGREERQGLLTEVGLETHRQPDAVATGVVAEHIAGHQPGAGHYDVVLAAVELDPEPQRVEGVETEQAPLLAEVFGASPFHHVAQRPTQQRQIADGGTAAQIEAEIFRVGLAGHAGRGAAKALQMLVGVAQLGVYVLSRGEEFIVEHQGAAQAIDIEPAAIEKVEVLAGVLAQQPVADAQIAGHCAQGDVAEGTQHPVAAVPVPVQSYVPANPAGGRQTVPFGGNGAGLAAVAHHELGIVAAKAQRPLQIDGHALAHGGAAADLGHVERRRLVGAAADIDVAGGDVGHDCEGHQRHHSIGALLHQRVLVGHGVGAEQQADQQGQVGVRGV